MSDAAAAFVKARGTEDEAEAPKLHHEDCDLWAGARLDIPSSCDCDVPARVLRDVEAAKAIVREYWRAKYALAQMERMAADDPPALERPRAEADVWQHAVRLLASRWSNHQDYADLTREQRAVIAAEGT